MSDFGTAQLPKPGDVVGGKYSLERIIGQGGMGAVFAARHVKLGHAVAIKVMLADRQNEEAARRFMNEGRASAHIQNEHVVRIFDIDEEHGYAYMVLELLQGEDLAQVLEGQRRLAPHIAVGYVVQALEGVQQAHALGIVHRDLKPSNLFLARLQSGAVVVKVLDFGISKARGASSLDMAPQKQTSTAAMLGSPLYMSPEQLRSSKNVDARADIWAMGVILYELLTGEVPFEGETLGALFSAILETDAPRVSAKVHDVPAGLDAIIARCLQRRPEDRLPTASDLARELAPFAAAQPAAFAMMMTAAMAPPATAYVAQSSPAVGPQHAGSVPGTAAPLGAVTPQLHRQTANAWQNTGSTTVPKTSTGVFVGIFALLLIIGIGGIAFYVHWRSGGGAGKATTASASSTTATVAVAGVAATDAPPPATPSVAIVNAAASAAPTAPATNDVPVAPPSAPVAAATTTITKRAPPTTSKGDPKPPAIVKVGAPPTPAPPPPTPAHTAPTQANGTLQGAR